MTRQTTNSKQLAVIREALMNSGQLPVAILLRSVRGGFGPINAALKGLDDIKIRELPDEERREIESKRQDLMEFKEGLRAICLEAAERSGALKELLTYFNR
jgi:hypothetical protein